MTRCNTLLSTVALAAAAFVAQNAAIAQSTSPAATGATGMAQKGGDNAAGAVSRADRQFAMEAAKGGMAEVALGQMARQKGGSDAVKQFGARMVDDHTKANDELKQLAAAKGIALPAEPPKDANAKKLEAMSGSGFDRAYMKQMLADHKKTVALFEKQSRSSNGDPELKAFATKTLPIIQAHLQMLQDGQHASAEGGASMKQQ